MDSWEKADSLLPHGGYRKLRSYKVAEAVYNATVVFCRCFYPDNRRMADQMVQAARSGVRNISEGSGAAATSRQVQSQGKAFLEKGGFTEKLYDARKRSLSDKSDQSDRSDRSDRSGRSDKSDQKCPDCGRSMRLRTARKGPNAGKSFWGCSGFPNCKGTLPVAKLPR
jgi:hypothetical protein